MWQHVLEIAGLSVLCGAWVIVQRYVARHDPEAPGVEGKGGCRHHHGSSCSSRVK